VAWVLRLVELREVRNQTGGRSYRLLGFFDGSELLILTSGFAKKQQTTPRRELDLAETQPAEYFERKRRKP